MITIHHLCFRYGRRPPLFDQLNWQLPPGCVVGLFGKNGSGKTTLLKILGGLRFPTSGQCRVLNHQPAERTPAFLQQVYFVSEEPGESRARMQAYVRHYAPFYPRFDADYLHQLLRDFQLDIGERLSNLSYGQRKKFFIAFALATNCPLLLMDEPTNGLDIPSKRQFRRMVAAAMTEGRTLIISTHQVPDLETLIDRVVMLDRGRIIFNQTTDEIATNYRFDPDRTTLPETTLYQEEALGRYQTLTINPSQTPSRVNLELLFNAVMAHPENFTNLTPDEQPL